MYTTFDKSSPWSLSTGLIQYKNISCLKDYKNSKSKSYIFKNSNGHMDIILLVQLKKEKLNSLNKSGFSGLQVHVIQFPKQKQTVSN